MTTPRLRRERITWTRWDSKVFRTRISHPWQWIYTDPEGDEHCFDTRGEAEQYALDIWDDP